MTQPLGSKVTQLLHRKMMLNPNRASGALQDLCHPQGRQRHLGPTQLGCHRCQWWACRHRHESLARRKQYPQQQRCQAPSYNRMMHSQGHGTQACGENNQCCGIILGQVMRRNLPRSGTNRVVRSCDSPSSLASHPPHILFLHTPITTNSRHSSLKAVTTVHRHDQPHTRQATDTAVHIHDGPPQKTGNCTGHGPYWTIPLIREQSLPFIHRPHHSCMPVSPEPPLSGRAISHTLSAIPLLLYGPILGGILCLVWAIRERGCHASASRGGGVMHRQSSQSFRRQSTP